MPALPAMMVEETGDPTLLGHSSKAAERQLQPKPERLAWGVKGQQADVRFHASMLGAARDTYPLDWWTQVDTLFKSTPSLYCYLAGRKKREPYDPDHRGRSERGSAGLV
jgi:hypothetical protein